MPAMRCVHVHLLPSLIPPGALRGGVAVVVDVLRATTVMVHALAAGCEAILPCLEVDDARRVAASLPPGTAILGGERQGLPIDGFDLGNSPDDYTPQVCRGKTVVMTTTNGTRAILASLEAERVLIGAFANVTATITQCLDALRRSIPVHLVCAGTDGQISLEDTALAGLIVHTLEPRGFPAANDSATLARMAWALNDGSIGYRYIEPVEDDAERLDLACRESRDTLTEREERLRTIFLSAGRGGRRVTEIGLEADIRAASRLDGYHDLIAEVRRDPVRIVGRGPRRMI
jgi:2-phosphosulfolactate phosphatase